MADEMHRRTLVGALRLLFQQLLHAVFAAAVHTGGDCFLHARRVVHLRCRAELDLLRVAATAPRRLCHLLPDRRDICADVIVLFHIH